MHSTTKSCSHISILLVANSENKYVLIIRIIRYIYIRIHIYTVFISNFKGSIRNCAAWNQALRGFGTFGWNYELKPSEILLPAVDESMQSLIPRTTENNSPVHFWLVLIIDSRKKFTANQKFWIKIIKTDQQFCCSILIPKNKNSASEITVIE